MRRRSKKKQAVVIIHGIGEQIPMDTIRGFVNAVWVTDEDLICVDEPDGDIGGSDPRDRNPVWTKPDKRNRSFELRRITTEPDDSGRRTDFYEYYWAHMMHGTKLNQVIAWIMELFTRPMHKVPTDVRRAYWLGRALVAVVAIAVLAMIIWLPMAWSAIVSFLSLGVVAFVIGLLKGKVIDILVTSVGDVVRYIKPHPVNVGRRQEIRENGVRLLETLMGVTPEKIAEFEAWKKGDRPRTAKKPQWDTEYDRIIVVGHSLGSIVGYDLLKYLYARLNRLGFTDYPDQPHREELERRCRLALINDEESEREEPGPDDPPKEEWQELTTAEFRKLQRAAFIEQRGQGSPWIVSDFVTLGAALTHAEFLMADDETDLREQQAARILPTCPPVLEWDRHTDKDHFSYRVPSPSTLSTESRMKTLKRANAQHFRYPHHAAHFAFTRWTNLYSPSKWPWKGDIISGPLAEHFAMHDRRQGALNTKLVKGIKDVAVLDHGNAHEKPAKGFTHLHYWEVDQKCRIPDLDVPHHIRELRLAVDLLFTEDQEGLDTTTE